MSAVWPNASRPAAGVRRFQVPLALPSPDHLHVHVVETPDGELLVDTGAVGSEAALHAGLEQIGGSRPAVLITHGHVDHWGLACELSDAVFAHRGVLPSLHFDARTWQPSGYPGAPPSDRMRVFSSFQDLARGVPRVHPIADGDRLGDWEVLWTAGHCPGHVCLFRERDGVLLCGDVLLPGFTPNVQPSWDGSDALADYLASLDRLAELPIRLVLPAHGEPYADARGRAAELKSHHAARLDVLRDALATVPRTLADLRDRAFSTDLPSPADRMLAELETFAHLDHLRRRGDVAVTEDGWWSLAA